MNKKIANELKQFKEFKQNFNFIMKPIIEKDGKLFCADEMLQDENGKVTEECDKWINVGYVYKNSLSKTLSNLYPYEFKFKGQQLHSLESFFQGIKYPDPEVQKFVFTYSGLTAYHLRANSDYDWRQSGYIYWQGQKIKRDSAEYADLVDELYISACQNPLFRMALKKIDKDIIHSMGKYDKTETTLTRYELEFELNCLSAFLKL